VCGAQLRSSQGYAVLAFAHSVKGPFQVQASIHHQLRCTSAPFPYERNNGAKKERTHYHANHNDIHLLTKHHHGRLRYLLHRP
jgi:hypothetical protein